MHLDCAEWLTETASYVTLESDIEILVEVSVCKVTRFLDEFKPFLVAYWENIQIMDFKNVTHHRLKNPLEVIPLLIQRFEKQK